MSTIPRRLASAFAVLCGRYGDVTELAKDRDRSRQSLYREAEEVVQAVDGTATEDRLEELRQRLADQEAENRSLRQRLEHAMEITRDVQEEFATVAQAEGVSLGVARRLLQVVAGSEPVPGVAMNLIPRTISISGGEPFNDRQPLDALSISLNTIVRHAALAPLPLVLSWRSRTVKNIDSIGFVVRMWTQCSAGKSWNASNTPLSFPRHSVALGYLAR